MPQQFCLNSWLAEGAYCLTSEFSLKYSRNGNRPRLKTLPHPDDLPLSARQFDSG
jgi:hypothetical protein